MAQAGVITLCHYSDLMQVQVLHQTALHLLFKEVCLCPAYSSDRFGLLIVAYKHLDLPVSSSVTCWMEKHLRVFLRSKIHLEHFPSFKIEVVDRGS